VVRAGGLEKLREHSEVVGMLTISAFGVNAVLLSSDIPIIATVRCALPLEFLVLARSALSFAAG
jgi:hypothetical protein